MQLDPQEPIVRTRETPWNRIPKAKHQTDILHAYLNTLSKEQAGWTAPETTLGMASSSQLFSSQASRDEV